MMGEPFAICPVEILLDRRLSLIQTRVLLALRSFFNPRKPHEPVYPRLATLGERCGYSSRTITSATNALCELGYLRKEPGRGRRASRYWLLDPEVSEPDTPEVSEPITPEVSEPGTPIRTDQRNIPTEVVAIVETPNNWVALLAEVWNDKIGSPPYGRIGKACRDTVRQYGIGNVLPVWSEYLGREQPRFISPERFAAQFLSLRSGAFFDENIPEDPNKAVLRRLLEKKGDFRCRD